MSRGCGSAVGCLATTMVTSRYLATAKASAKRPRRRSEALSGSWKKVSDEVKTGASSYPATTSVRPVLLHNAWITAS